MFAALKWYFVLTLAGWVVWPLGFRHLRALPDRGYLSSRALGLLLVGYTFWMMASLGLVENTPGAMLLAAVIVAGVGIWQYRARPNPGESLRGWLRDNRTLVLVGEALFLLAFVAWVIVRAHDPALNTTEKPMELTFLNGVRMSRTFPPRDPWLAGYAISYYYFGYVIVAMLADLSAVASPVAFNLAIAMLFALTVLGAFAVVYNLMALNQDKEATPSGLRASTIFPALLGPLLVAVMGNLGGLLELLRALRFPRSDAFWGWLDVPELNGPLQSGVLWPPDRWRFWWWWRASRVINDRHLFGEPVGKVVGVETIDEFPIFSFLLGDMHPHVLALPFALLAVAFALNLAANRAGDERLLDRAGFVLYGIVVGALAFLNAWDLPIYLFVVAGAAALRLMPAGGGHSLEGLGRAALFGLSLLLASIALYLPFYVGFRSQASGILPNALFPTRLPNFLVMFGPLLFVAIWFVVKEARPWRPSYSNWVLGVPLAVGVLAALVGLMVLLGVRALDNSEVQNFLLYSAGLGTGSPPVQSAQRAAALQEAVQLVIDRRRQQTAVALSLTVLLAFVFSGFFRARRLDRTETGKAEVLSSDFALLLIGTGALLVLGPEFLYLRDTFGQRINTVFKFYYAAWVLFALAAAYAAWVIPRDARSPFAVRGVFAVLTGLLVVCGLVYPALAIPAKADFAAAPTLDGIAYVQNLSPGDLAAVRWLQANAHPDAIVLEAVGGQYTFYGRVSTMTGLPTLLGWPGHELQWRGSLDSAGTREADVRTIYTTPDMRTAQALLDSYGVTYVFVGSLERRYASPAGLEKFDRFLTRVYHNDDASIYRADQPLPAEEP